MKTEMEIRGATGPFTLDELASRIDATVAGDGSIKISGVNGLTEAKEGDLSFITNAHYRDQLAATKASAVVIKAEMLHLFDVSIPGRGALVSPDPYLSFAKASAAFHPPKSFPADIHPRAIVESDASVHPTVTIMAGAYVGHGAQVGAGTVVYPFVFIGDDVSVGEDVILYPGVVVREGCTIGDRAILQPGVIIGGDGFGFAFNPAVPEHFKIPQAGVVHIGSDVEIGANSAIDRATNGVTSIGDGTKIDNLVQIGHNVTVGQLSILCGQVGIAGSSTLGKGVVCGGQVGMGNLVHICDGARIGPKGGVMSDVTEPGEYLGAPIVKSRDFMRQQATLHQAPELMKTVRRLEKQVAVLEATLSKMTAQPSDDEAGAHEDH